MLTLTAREAHIRQPVTHPPDPSAPLYRFPTLVCVVIASMIGAGVFTTSGYSLQTLGSPLRVLIAWLMGGILAVCGAISYGELARRLPQSGGEYLYLSRRLHPFVGFLAGLVSLTAGFSGAIAAAALTFEAYALPVELRPAWMPPNAVAAMVVLLCGCGHGLIVRTAAILQNAVVVVKLAGLVCFLLLAFTRLSTHTWHWEALPGAAAPFSWKLVPAFAISTMWISFSYAGFNAAVYVAAETAESRRTVPRAVITGTLIVTLLYLLLNLVFVTAAPGADIIVEERIGRVAATASVALGGGLPATLLSVLIALATVSSVAGMVMTGPRVYTRMADDGLFLNWFRSGPHTVLRSVSFQTVIAVLLILAGTLRDLLDYLGTTLSLSSAIAVATLFLPLPRRRHDFLRDDGDVCDPGSRPSVAVLACAVTYVVATLTFIVIMTINFPSRLLGTLATLGGGAVIWVVTRSARHRVSDPTRDPLR